MIRKIMVIGDTQVKPGVPIDHFEYMGNWIVEHKPEVIVDIGDHWDFPSLSRWDKGTVRMEGRRIMDDVYAGNDAMISLMLPMVAYNHQQRLNKKALYKPQMHFCVGNHEDRLSRFTDHHPEALGAISDDMLYLDGWTVHPFLQPVVIEGVSFCHYFTNQGTGKPLGGNMEYRIAKVMRSFVQGHEQGLRYAQVPAGDRIIHGLQVGSCYLHDEDYRGPQGNRHFRGFCVLNNVSDGEYDLEVHSIDSVR